MKYHFTPAKGWTNDPNGLIQIGDTYHLFYQHYPNDIIWGPMHWGHATSKDLIHWQHLPIALYPDDLGYIFSGSCFYDEHNDSGLGTKDNPPIIAMYTSHHPDTNDEQQSIAYSLDGINFTPYPHNPVIKNNASIKKDFRDPKVFKNPVLGGYTVALAAGPNIEFYHSNNFIDWSYTGSFDAQANGLSGICECPDCIQMGDQWILIISSVIDKEHLDKPIKKHGYQNKHIMEYFIGTFDGYTFIDEKKAEETLLLDYGPDNYAMVSFSNTTSPILLGWGNHWDYVKNEPATISRGRMTLAREIKFVDGHLTYSPIGDVPKENYTIPVGSTIHLENSVGDYLSIEVTDTTIIVDRSHFQGNTVDQHLLLSQYNHFEAPRILSGDSDLCLIQDEGYLECFFDQGSVAFTINTYQTTSDKTLVFKKV